jgi:hypothetical protein
MVNLCIQTVAEQKSAISWETIVAILGALAWLPWLFDKFNSSKIYGNVISYHVNSGRFKNKEGLLYFFKLSVSCINKNFNIKSIDIYVKYANNNNWFKGSIFWARTSYWIMENGESKQLILPNDNFLGFVNVLEKDKSDFYYLTFLVETQTLQDFELIKFEFVNQKNDRKTFEISRNNIDNDRILFDDSLWK